MCIPKNIFYTYHSSNLYLQAAMDQNGLFPINGFLILNLCWWKIAEWLTTFWYAMIYEYIFMYIYVVYCSRSGFAAVIIFLLDDINLIMLLQMGERTKII